MSGVLLCALALLPSVLTGAPAGARSAVSAGQGAAASGASSRATPRRVPRRRLVSVRTSPLALVGGVLIDGTGAPPVPDAVVVIHDGRIVAAGGTVALGTDYDGYDAPFQLGMPVIEMRLMEDAGMTPMQIIAAATRNAARASARGASERGRRTIARPARTHTWRGTPALEEPPAPLARPAWTFDAGSPMWPGATFRDGLVYARDDAGTLHALDGATGKEQWRFRPGGSVRTRVAVAEGIAYFQADDGFLYAVTARSGQERYRVRVVPERTVRLPFSDPASHYDRFGSDVVPAKGVLYLGTHDGRILCLRAADGARAWEHATGGSVLAAPALAGGRVPAASYDGAVYALDAATGTLLWKHDTGRPVVSTPAVSAGRLIVGSRGYDLLALDATTGKLIWTYYLWFSWIESSAVVRDGVAPVGSSDAAIVLAVDATTGRRIWAADVWGWAWGQPAVSGDAVFIGTCAMPGYPAPHRGQALAVDRASGRLLWSFGVTAPKEGTYGFAGSACTGAGRVVFTGFDGRVYVFAE